MMLVSDLPSTVTASAASLRLTAEFDWLSLSCDDAAGSADGIEFAAADIVRQAAIASCSEADGDIEGFFAHLLQGLEAHVGRVRCELQLARRRPLPSDCVAAAWWLAMIALASARESPTGERPQLVVLLQPMTTKWQLVVTEYGNTVAQAAQRVAGAMPHITEHVSGAHGCQGGRWGSLVYLRFAAETVPPPALSLAPRSRGAAAPSVSRQDEAVSTERLDRRAS